jgi:hypothetical protein
MKSAKFLKLVAGLIFAWYFLSSALTPDKWHFIDNVDLIIHEAGHWIFIIFGQFMSVLGGSLTQIAIPFIFVLYFYFKKDIYSASILAMWCGYNIVNVAHYLSDSVYMRLPLLGGESSIHDWNYILSSLNLLNQTSSIASVINAIGIFVIVIGAVLAVKYYKTQFRPEPVDFN